MTVPPAASLALRHPSEADTSSIADASLSIGQSAPSEQQLIRELYDAIARTKAHYGSQNAAARALGISSATLTRASPGWLKTNAAHDRLPRPHRSTLIALTRCQDERVRATAIVLLQRRGIDIPF
jgi:hypothetical protein